MLCMGNEEVKRAGSVSTKLSVSFPNKFLEFWARCRLRAAIRIRRVCIDKRNFFSPFLFAPNGTIWSHSESYTNPKNRRKKNTTFCPHKETRSTSFLFSPRLLNGTRFCWEKKLENLHAQEKSWLIWRKKNCILNSIFGVCSEKNAKRV